MKSKIFLVAASIILPAVALLFSAQCYAAYVVVDSGQSACYSNNSEISCPQAGGSFYGQDSQYSGVEPRFVDNGDGTVTDLNTGLMWQQNPGGKMTYDQAVAGAASFSLAGYADWRLPSIKELYSLILFSGVDPSGYEGSDTSGLVPFIDTDYFDFEYGDTGAGERIIDSQYLSSTKYVSTTMDGDETAFGINFADGRIKGYGMTLHGSDKTFFVMYVRGNTDYGKNSFTDNGDGTITDSATGLIWMKNDSAAAHDWEEALDYAENLSLAGYSDWRLPDAKELQSIVDYSRSPDTTASAAIDPAFNVSSIINEGGQQDYPCYWSGTTHANWTGTPGRAAAYVAFGRGLGYMDGEWQDVHGAGCQRSDPKSGDPDDYPTGNGPQGDAIRIYNHVRCVRGTSAGGAGVLDIKINGEDGPLSVSSTQTVDLTVSLDPGVYAGTSVDWWLGGLLNGTQIYCWSYGSGWSAAGEPVRAYGGPLVSLDGYAVARGTIPPGSWTFIFAVDGLDNTYEGTYSDSISIESE